MYRKLGGTKGTRQEQGIIIFSMEKKNENHQLGTGFLNTTEKCQQVRVEFVSDRVSYMVLRGRWCNIIVLNVHAPSVGKSDNLTTVFMRNEGRFFIFFLSTI